MPGSLTMNAARPRLVAMMSSSEVKRSSCSARPTMGLSSPTDLEPAPAGRRGLSADDAKGVDRLGLALDLDLAEIVEVERVAAPGGGSSR